MCVWSFMCAQLSPLAAHAEHHNEDRNNKGWGSSDSTQQQDLAVGRSREVQPVLHGGHVGALALTCSHTRSHSHPYAHARREVPRSHWDLQGGTEQCLITKWSNLYETLSTLTKQRSQNIIFTVQKESRSLKREWIPIQDEALKWADIMPQACASALPCLRDYWALCHTYIDINSIPAVYV